jgi:hypothetical protein
MKNLKLSNSIYQQKGSGIGLGVKDGMLINNRPNSITGIQQAVEIKKSMRKAEKVSTMAEAYALGERMSEMNGGDCCM